MNVYFLDAVTKIFVAVSMVALLKSNVPDAGVSDDPNVVEMTCMYSRTKPSLPSGP